MGIPRSPTRTLAQIAGDTSAALGLPMAPPTPMERALALARAQTADAAAEAQGQQWAAEDAAGASAAQPPAQPPPYSIIGPVGDDGTVPVQLDDGTLIHADPLWLEGASQPEIDSRAAAERWAQQTPVPAGALEGTPDFGAATLAATSPDYSRAQLTQPRTPPPVRDLTGGAGVAQARGARSAGRGGGRAPMTAQAPIDPNQATVDALMQRGSIQQAFPQDYAREGAAAAQGRLVDQQRQIEQRRAEIAGGAAASQADILAQQEAARRELESQRREAEGAAMRRLQEANARVAEMRVNPQQWWADRGFAGSAAAAIAMALGSFGEALGGGPNAAAALIRSAIDDDIEAQRANIDNARASAESERGIYSLVRQRFDDEEGARQAATAAMLGQLEQQIAQQAAGLDSQEAMQRAEALRLELRQQREAAEAQALSSQVDRELDVRARMAQVRIREARASREERRAAGAGGPRPEEPVTAAQLNAFDRLLRAGVSPGEAAQRAGLPAGFVPPQATDVDQQGGGLDALDASLRRLEELTPREGDVPGVGRLDSRAPDWALSDAGAALRQELVNTTDLLGRLRSGAAISAEEEERFTRILGAGVGQSDEAFRRGLGIIRRELGARLQRRARSSSDAQAMDARDAELGLTDVVE